MDRRFEFWYCDSCKNGAYIDDTITLMQYPCLACELPVILLSIYLPIFNSGFSALRVYAMMEYKRPLTVVVFLLNLVPFGTNLVSIVAIRRYLMLHSRWTKFNSITRVIVQDSELCTVFSGASNDTILVYVPIEIMTRNLNSDTNKSFHLADVSLSLSQRWPCIK